MYNKFGIWSIYVEVLKFNKKFTLKVEGMCCLTEAIRLWIGWGRAGPVIHNTTTMSFKNGIEFHLQLMALYVQRVLQTRYYWGGVE